MRAALRVFAMACCFAACAVIANGPWATLQTVAWAKMAVDYTREAGDLRQGLAETFDGQHPCELCRQIKAGTKKEASEQPQKSGKQESVGKLKLVAVLPVNPGVVFSGVTGEVISFPSTCRGRLLDAPPTPPPRVA